MYLHNNPVRARLYSSEEDCKYSTASLYSSGEDKFRFIEPLYFDHAFPVRHEVVGQKKRPTTAELMKSNMHRYFIGLLLCCVLSSIILGLNFYGTISSASISVFLTIPSALYGLIFFMRFINDFFVKNESQSMMVKIILLLVSLPCLLFLLANCYAIVYYIIM